mgnify:CR=1 FL=1
MTHECLNTKGESEVDALKLIAQDSLKAEKPSVEVGDTVKVHVRIKEGERERIQNFEGPVIARQHGGISEGCTVRRVAPGVGIERVFHFPSPTAVGVDVVRSGKLRRGKLDYLRGRVVQSA